jgi:hypothetical protein
VSSLCASFQNQQFCNLVQLHFLCNRRIHRGKQHHSQMYMCLNTNSTAVPNVSPIIYYYYHSDKIITFNISWENYLKLIHKYYVQEQCKSVSTITLITGHRVLYTYRMQAKPHTYQRSTVYITQLIPETACDTIIRRSTLCWTYSIFLTHGGRVTQTCVCTLQRCKTGDANLRF